MPDYHSSYTGAQIDAGIAKISSFAHTPAEIDASVTKVESINSTASDIDDAVNYLQILEGEVLPSQIREAYDYIDDLTVIPEDINQTVDRLADITSNTSDIDDAVDILTHNTATAGQTLIANGTGGVSFTTATTLYSYAVNFFDGANPNRSIITLFYLSTAGNLSTWTNLKHELSNHNTLYRMYPCGGEYTENGNHHTIIGIYFENGGNDTYLVSLDDGVYAYHLVDLSTFYFGCTQEIVW